VWPDLAADVLLDVARELSLEGVVMKGADSTYQPARRSKSWLKSVLRRRAAVVLAGWIPGAAESLGSLIVGAHNTSGDLVCCGVISSGLNSKSRTALNARLSEIQTAQARFRDMLPSAAVRWVHPRLVAMIVPQRLPSDTSIGGHRQRRMLQPRWVERAWLIFDERAT
jgi:bifunctional non-homologous end joining protein LigD